MAVPVEESAMPQLPVGTLVEALYGEEAEWHKATIVESSVTTVSIPASGRGSGSGGGGTSTPTSVSSPSPGRGKKKEVKYFLQYSDGDVGWGSRFRVRVAGEKQTRLLCVGQQVRAGMSGSVQT